MFPEEERDARPGLLSRLMMMMMIILGARKRGKYASKCGECTTRREGGSEAEARASRSTARSRVSVAASTPRR